MKNFWFLVIILLLRNLLTLHQPMNDRTHESMSTHNRLIDAPLMTDRSIVAHPRDRWTTRYYMLIE